MCAVADGSTTDDTTYIGCGQSASQNPDCPQGWWHVVLSCQWQVVSLCQTQLWHSCKRLVLGPSRRPHGAHSTLPPGLWTCPMAIRRWPPCLVGQYFGTTLGINPSDTVYDPRHSFVMAQSGVVNGGGLDWLAHFSCIIVNLSPGHQNQEDHFPSAFDDGPNQSVNQGVTILAWTSSLAHISLALLAATVDLPLQSLGPPTSYHSRYGP